MADDIPPEVRALVMRRANGRCERCLRTGLVLDLHHRKQRSLGGLDTAANLVACCRRCHNRVHDQVPFDRVYENGWLLRSWEDPQTIPILMPRGRMRLADSGDCWRLAS